MAETAQDGALLIGELRDNAELRSNLLDHTITGREQIARCVLAIEHLCRSQSVILHKRFGPRDYIMSVGVLPTGEPVDIETVGVRDESGWVCAISIHHGPPRVARMLRAKLAGDQG